MGDKVGEPFSNKHRIEMFDPMHGAQKFASCIAILRGVKMLRYGRGHFGF